MGQVLVGVFSYGQLSVTKGAFTVVSESERISALTRHINADWGDVSVDDAEMNNEALETKDMILSSYHTAEGVKFWIITDADWKTTTILLPEEY